MRSRFLVALLGAFATCFIASCASDPALADDNGLLAVKVCGPTTATGQQCVIPNSDGSLNTSGGGGGVAGAVYGPTATGSAAANPPVQAGGTINGGATGNVQGFAMKAASTAPAATDPALVVAVSPNGGQATSALQTTGNTSLGTIATNSGTQATAANQTTGNTSAATTATNTGTTATNTGTTATNTGTTATNTGTTATALGAPGDTACASDNGTCSAIALIKRTNQNVTTLNTTAAAAVAAGTNRIGYTSDDPCAQLTKLGASINLTASGQVITGTASVKTYVCSIDVTSATAQNIALVEGTGTVCATNIFGLAGGTTAATGWNLAANGGLTKGSGNGTVFSPSADANAAAANVCLLSSSTGQISGQITYVKQ